MKLKRCAALRCLLFCFLPLLCLRLLLLLFLLCLLFLPACCCCCCHRQRGGDGNVVGQFVGNFKRPTNCSKICHNVVHDRGHRTKMLQVSTTTTTTQLTTKSHNNSDSSETRRDKGGDCVIFLSSAGPNFLAVAACVFYQKIQLLVGFGLQSSCGERGSRAEAGAEAVPSVVVESH